MGRRSTRPRKPSLFERSERFLSDYMAGLSGDELRRLVDRDARGAYSVLMREREAEVAAAVGIQRYLLAAKLLFLSISEKLSPRRRLLFGVAIVSALAGFIDPRVSWMEGGRQQSLGGAGLFYLVAVVCLLLLLAFEMVDRVLVRDEIQIARQLQRDLLPKASPDVLGYAFAHSSKTANDIGGDYYQLHRLTDGRLAIVVADASGHGMAAGLLMAIANATLHIALELDPSPVAVGNLLHRAIWRTGDRRSFLTLFYALLDPTTGEIDCVSAGHPFPLLRRASGSIEELELGSFPLGMREKVALATGRLALHPGDLLVLFSDGLFEGIDRRGQAFGFDRLRSSLANSTSAAGAHERIQAAFATHVGSEPLADDLTLLVVERLPSGGESG